MIATQNSFGWTSTLPNPMTFRFFEAIKHLRSPTVIDIGAAFGVATLPALEYGATVIANDIDDTHLSEIIKAAERAGHADRLRTLNARCPDLPYLQLDAIHASNILHFLSGREIMRAAAWMMNSLKLHGRAYIQVQSPFCGHFQSFLTEYERRRKAGKRWPGEIRNARDYAAPSIRGMTAPFNHVLERDVAAKAFADVGFTIEYCDYYTRPGLPDVSKLDGRENLGLVVAKRR